MPNKKDNTAYCERIGESFPIAYSKAGISHFECPRFTQEAEEVSCKAVEGDGCPVYEKLEGMIAEGNGRE